MHAWNWGPSFSKATSIQIQIFLKPHFFDKNCSSIHTQQVNPLTETTSFWNRSSELSRLLSTQIWVTKYEVFKMFEFINTLRVHTVLKSPWILGEVLEESLTPFFLEKSWNFSASPWKVLEFSLTLNLVARKVFFDAFWLSKTEYKSQLREIKGYLHKVLNLICNN